MPTANQPPSVGSQVGGTIGRTSALERKSPQRTAVRLEPLRWSYSGTLDVDIESPPEYVEAPTVLTEVRVSLTAAAAGDNTVEVRVGGTGIQQFTLTAGNLTVVVACNIVVFPGVPLTVKTVTAVSGSDLSVIARRLLR